MKEIHIHDNPWLCDCKLDWIVTILMPIIEKTTPHLINHITCNEPEPMVGFMFKEMNEEEYQLRCMDLYGAHPERDSGLLVALFIGVLLGIPLAFSFMFLYKRGCRRHQTSHYNRAFYTKASSNEFAEA